MKQKAARKRRNVKKIAGWILLALMLLGLMPVGYIEYSYGKNAPDLAILRGYQEKIHQNGTAYCNDGKTVLGRFPFIEGYDKNGKPVYSPLSIPAAYGGIPTGMITATVAAEDRKFYDHGGVDYVSLVRVGLHNMKVWITGEGQEHGGSTIDMQLIKLFFFAKNAPFGSHIPTKDGTWDRTLFKWILSCFTSDVDKWDRKFFEWVMSRRLKKTSTAEEILEMYLNLAPFGSRDRELAQGVPEGMRIWFGDQPLQTMTTAQAAFLASLYKAPSNLFNNPKKPNWPMERRNYVIDGLADIGYISTASAAALKELPLGLAPKPGNMASDTTGFLRDHVLRQLIEILGPEEATAKGIKVYTTFDCALQTIAEAAFREGLEQVEKNLRITGSKRLDGGLIVTSPTGHILAMVGGRTKQGAGTFNRVIQAKRQIGSTFKPFTYALAYEHPDLWETFPPTCLDVRRSYRVAESKPPSNWNPQNYGDTYTNQEISTSEGLEASSNACMANLMWRIGGANHPGELDGTWTSTRTIHLEPIMELMDRFGKFPTFTPYKIRPYEPSKIIGAGELPLVDLAAMYQVFYEGKFAEAVWIKRIELGGADRTPLIYDPVPVFSETVAFLSREDLKRAAGKFQEGIPVEVAGKTGSTNQTRTGLFVGLTPTFIAAAWVGFDDNRPLPKGAVGGNTARVVVKRFTERATELEAYATPSEFPPPPPGIRFETVNDRHIAVPESVTSTVVEDSAVETE